MNNVNNNDDDNEVTMVKVQKDTDYYIGYVRGIILHRLNGPAFIHCHESGLVKSESWYINGKLHRLHDPANVEYHDNGIVKSESWYINGKLHRLDGPAKVEYQIDGSIHKEYWYVAGKKHRLLDHTVDYSKVIKVESGVWFDD
ncbi:toxin-antitoxin system YwqK family antitoxin [Shewanella sp.]|uniref:toxin-antitoxin system YwqK family antitoxin n=1 Tax=Shewanella sp. TaxID=50422 RepID=UPI0040471F99